MKKPIKFFVCLGLLCVLMTPLAHAKKRVVVVDQPAPVPVVPVQEGLRISSKVPVSLYGFVSAQMFVADSQLGSLGANQNPAAPNRVIDETTVPADDSFLAFGLQNSRLGLYLEPYDFGGKSFTVDARFEIDFFELTATSQALQQPRIRRAYTSIGNDSWRFLAGQEWELFAPLNTPTLNLGSNLWNQGNLGFRRPQMRVTYQHKYDKSGLELGASVNSPSNSIMFNDLGNTTVIPMLQGRVGYWRDNKPGKLETYVSATFGRHDNAVAGGAKVNNWGFAASLNAPLISKYLTLMGEAHYGYSLGSALSIASNTTKQKTVGGWGAMQNQWCDWFETNVGYGMEDLQDSQVAAGGLASNSNIFGNLKFKPVKQFVLGLEYNYITSKYKGTGTSKASVAMANVMYSF